MNDLGPSSVLRSDPSEIDYTLKEAIAHSILGEVFQDVSGSGPDGKVIKGEKPSRRLSSAFLMPANPDELSLDDETSPTRITGSGFDFMIKSNSEGIIQVLPKFSLYIRILPSKDELLDSGVSFRLSHDVDRDVRRSIKEREKELWLQVKDDFGGDRNHKDWIEMRSSLTKNVYEEFGVYENSQVIEVESSIDEEEMSDDVFEIRGFKVKPGDSSYPSAAVVRNVSPIEKWVRIPIKCEPLEFDIKNRDDLTNVAELASLELKNQINKRINTWLESQDEDVGGRFWAYPKRRVFNPSEIANWDNTLETIRSELLGMNYIDRKESVALPVLDINWLVSIKKDWSDPSREVVHVALENRSRRPQRQLVKETEEAIFQVYLECSIPKSAHSYMRLDRIKPSYRFNRYLHYPALGFNCGVKERAQEKHVVLESDWMPKYGLPKIEPTTHGIDCRFKSLANSNISIATITDISKKLSSWISNLDIDVKEGLFDHEVSKIQREKNKYSQDKNAWERESQMIQRGIDLLSESSKFEENDNRSIPFQAWLLMNETMGRLAADRYDSWRLFQLAFILSSLPSFITRLPDFKDEYIPEFDDATTMLYFATGGGKSEAFFGLLVFALFFDRLRGKKIGVTAMLRYPLRLLTVQQAQRASRVLAKAELVRRDNSISGAPFSLGFWVGSSNTPNNHSAYGVSDIPYIDENETDEEELRSTNKKYNQAASDWLKVPKCPFCGGRTGLRRSRSNTSIIPHGVVGHCCMESECDWNISSGNQPLPFYIVDEDIYSIAPSILLGTIDKLALIGQSTRTIQRILGMFGFAAWQDPISDRLICPTPQEYGNVPEGVRYLSPVYSKGDNIFIDPFPSLLVQDEAHLLEESLGTFAGLFETTLLKVFNTVSNYLPRVATSDEIMRMPKIVAATATVTDPERQIENLYQRNLIQFPYPGPKLYESFYAKPVKNEDSPDSEDIERRAYIRRIYATILTNGKPHTTASISILSAFHTKITYLFNSLLSENDEQKAEIKESLKTALNDSEKKSIYIDSINSSSIEDIATLIDLHRIALTYVTNKKGGDQILAAESEQVKKDHNQKNLQHTNFDRRLITGSVDAGLIQQVIELAEDRAQVGDNFQDLNSCLRSIVATSAISHGVDVEELNSMFFAGMPSDIAEYIQASSRVGRTHVGFSLLLPVPQRKRDRYIVETHDIFHRFLERMIQPPAIDRWAERAIERVVPSFFQTYLIANLGIQKLINEDDESKSRVPSFGRVSDVMNIAQDPVSFRNGVVKFISQSIGLETKYRPPNSEYYKEIIQIRVRKLFDNLQEADMRNLTLRDFFEVLAQRSPETLEKPMTSLRDVDVPGYIVPSPSATGGRNHLTDEQLAELMRILRHGGGGVTGRDGA